MLCYSEMPLNYLRVFRRVSWYPVCDTIFTKESTMLFSVTFKNIKYFHCISILHIQPLSKNYGVSWVWLCMENRLTTHKTEVWENNSTATWFFVAFGSWQVYWVSCSQERGPHDHFYCTISLFAYSHNNLWFFSLRVFSFKKTLMKNVFDMVY